ncbi:MAG: nucleotidyltransferase family protein [Candidatus Krumholzibacteriia bacterium]
MTGRHDCGVILARGASRRMGRPKGLCPAGRPGRSCLQAVADLYAGAGWPLAVVTTEALAGLYRPLLAGGPPVLWIVRAGGGDTAWSVVAALEALAGTVTHLWLHPVDLPQVAPATLVRLAALSRRAPDCVLVPAYRDTPGHPVVLPAAPFLALRGSRPEGPMRPLLLAAARGEGAARAPLRHVPVADPGVIADRDTPGEQGTDAAAASGEEDR